LEIRDTEKPVYKFTSKQGLSDSIVTIWDKKEEKDWKKIAKMKYSSIKQDEYNLKILDTRGYYKMSFKDNFNNMQVADCESGHVCFELKSFLSRIGSSGALIIHHTTENKNWHLLMSLLMVWIQESRCHLVTERPVTNKHIRRLIKRNLEENTESNNDDEQKPNIVINVVSRNSDEKNKARATQSLNPNRKEGKDKTSKRKEKSKSLVIKEPENSPTKSPSKSRTRTSHNEKLSSKGSDKEKMTDSRKKLSSEKSPESKRTSQNEFSNGADKESRKKKKVIDYAQIQ